MKTTTHAHLGAKLLLCLGLTHIPLVGFHFAFPALFGWNRQLPLLSHENAGLLLCLHACGIFWLTSMGTATFWEGYSRLKREAAVLPRGFWIWMAGFYLFRLAAVIPCFGISLEGLALMVLLGILAAFYLLAWFRLEPAKESERRLTRSRRPIDSWLI